MAKTCSRCGKTLGFRDELAYKGEVVCADCLNQITGEKTGPGEPVKESKVKGRKQEETPAQILKGLKTGGIGSIVFGVIAIALGLATAKDSPVNAGLAVIGIFLLIEGIWLLVSPQPAGLIVDGIALIILGIWNFCVTVANSSRGGSGGSFAVLGVFQVVWGIQSFRRYGRLKKLMASAESAAVQTEKEKALSPFDKARPYGSLFDKGFSHSNLFIGLLYFGAWVISTLILAVLDAAFSGRIFFGPASFILFRAVSMALGAFFLVFLSSRLSLWKLALAFGGIQCIIGILFRTILKLFETQRVTYGPVWDPSSLLTSFLWGCVAVGVLVWIVDRWGVKPLPLIPVLSLTTLVLALLSQGIHVMLKKGASFQIRFNTILGSLLDGAIFGAAMYWGLHESYKKRAENPHA